MERERSLNELSSASSEDDEGSAGVGGGGEKRRSTARGANGGRGGFGGGGCGREGGCAGGGGEYSRRSAMVSGSSGAIEMGPCDFPSTSVHVTSTEISYCLESELPISRLEYCTIATSCALASFASEQFNNVESDGEGGGDGGGGGGVGGGGGGGGDEVGCVALLVVFADVSVVSFEDGASRDRPVSGAE